MTLKTYGIILILKGKKVISFFLRSVYIPVVKRKAYPATIKILRENLKIIVLLASIIIFTLQSHQRCTNPHHDVTGHI